MKGRGRRTQAALTMPDVYSERYASSRKNKGSSKGRRELPTADAENGDWNSGLACRDVTNMSGISTDSEDSWANDSREEDRPSNISNNSDNTSDNRNVSIFSERDDYDEEASYPNDDDEYLLEQRKVNGKSKRDVGGAAMPKPREHKLSYLDRLMNAAGFHNVSHLTMAPPPTDVSKDTALPRVSFVTS